jgi:hypothetical protein
VGTWRFVLFAVACAAWLGAMLIRPESPLILAAGLAWFVNWSIQIAVTLIAWRSPFSLPARYYQSFADHSSASSARPAPVRVPGLRFYKRVAQWINPFCVDRASPHLLDAAIDAAETTHAVTFGIVGVLALLFAAAGAIGVAACLTLWNVLFNLYPIALQRHTRARLRRGASRLTRMRCNNSTKSSRPIRL